MTIQYRNKKYPAHIFSSTLKQPHFHWLIFDDPQLREIAGGEDSVCFQEINGELVCTNLTMRINIPALVDTAKSIVEDFLSHNTKQ